MLEKDAKSKIYFQLLLLLASVSAVASASIYDSAPYTLYSSVTDTDISIKTACLRLFLSININIF